MQAPLINIAALGRAIAHISSRGQSGWFIVPGPKPRRGNLFIATPRLRDLKPRRGDQSMARDRKRFPLDQPTGRFCWQEGFGAFSYGHSQLTGVINYVRDQERHHACRRFRDEYLRFLEKYEIEHDEKYIFKPLD